MPLTLSKNQLYTITVEIMQIVYFQTKKYFLYININNVIVFVKKCFIFNRLGFLRKFAKILIEKTIIMFLPLTTLCYIKCKTISCIIYNESA
jgi:hypothetical protein